LIDLHCHILPGADDGPSDETESVAMAEMAVADGIHTIVATPHSHNGIYIYSRLQVLHRVMKLQAVFERSGISLALCAGADVQLHAGLADRLFTDEVMTLNNGKKYLLVEFPHQRLTEEFHNELFRIIVKGVVPVITHPERHAALQERPEVLARLVQMGCLVQVTAMSITGDFGQQAMECAHGLLKRRLVHVIATDAHSAESRPPVLSEAVEVAARILEDDNEAWDMVTQRPKKILKGEPVSIPEPRKPKKRWFYW